MADHAAADESRCYAHKSPGESPPLFSNGSVHFQVHHVGWIVSGFFTIVATSVSIWLIDKHLQWYTNKREQRYIVRLLFMVPLYAIISFASYLFWNNAIPLILLRDGYEAIVLTGFFYLLLNYISNDPDEQRTVFLKHGISKRTDRELIKAGKKPTKWMWPCGFIKAKPADGLYFLQLMKWGVLQYCVIRPLTTLASIVLDYMGLYCEHSWSPGWGHLHVVLIVSLSVTVAMYCLIQIYMPVSEQLAPHKPLLKLFAIKAVVFLTFWQASLLSVLSMFGVVEDGSFMTAENINIGIGALLQTVEMMLFAFLHIKAFSYKPYVTSSANSTSDAVPQRTPRMKSLGHAFDFRETWREIRDGWLDMWDRMRKRESRYDMSVRRAAHLESALGVTRSHGAEKGRAPREDLNLGHTELDRAERQWLGIGDNHDYTLSPITREKSGDLEYQIERELERRGVEPASPSERYSGRSPAQVRRAQSTQQSWWRSMYHRVSQSGQEDSHLSPEHSSNRRHRSRHRARSRNVDRDTLLQSNFAEDSLADLPPRSMLQRYEQFGHAMQGASYFDQRRVPNDPYGLPDSSPIYPNGMLSPSADSMMGRVFPPSSTYPESSTTNLSTSVVRSDLSHPIQWKEVPRQQTTVLHPYTLPEEDVEEDWASARQSPEPSVVEHEIRSPPRAQQSSNATGPGYASPGSPGSPSPCSQGQRAHCLPASPPAGHRSSREGQDYEQGWHPVASRSNRSQAPRRSRDAHPDGRGRHNTAVSPGSRHIPHPTYSNSHSNSPYHDYDASYYPQRPAYYPQDTMYYSEDPTFPHPDSRSPYPAARIDSNRYPYPYPDQPRLPAGAQAPYFSGRSHRPS